MAACSMLKVLVTASDDDLTVFALPDSIASTPGVPRGLTRMCTIGGSGSKDERLQLKFVENGISGLMAFTGAAASTRLLLVTDAGNANGQSAVPCFLAVLEARDPRESLCVVCGRDNRKVQTVLE